MTCVAGRFGSPDVIIISAFLILSVACFVGVFVVFRFFALIQQFKFVAPEYYKVSYSAYRFIFDRIERRAVHMILFR